MARRFGRAIRSDFLHRFAEGLETEPGIIARVMHDFDAGTSPARYPIRIGGQEIVLDIPSPLVVAMLDSLQAPAADPRSLRDRGLRLATGAKTLLTVGVTATPEFAIKNAMRDMLCAFALGRI